MKKMKVGEEEGGRERWGRQGGFWFCFIGLARDTKEKNSFIKEPINTHAAYMYVAFLLVLGPFVKNLPTKIAEPT